MVHLNDEGRPNEKLCRSAAFLKHIKVLRLKVGVTLTHYDHASDEKLRSPLNDANYQKIPRLFSEMLKVRKNVYKS
eukprot:TRINITY_DN713_c0_g1_i1.p1 TRINITY_DN713_c0_g1~~TRINITY_DN713_c0_g1_i1.p1  ORF type:complete len:76 (-),score=0.46 TRINITY_DN713_c0_g1_i1:178-405(-)